MLLHGLLCPTCGEGAPARDSFPICPPCAEALLPCPSLCERCLGFSHRMETAPCVALDSSLDAVGAAFLVVGRARTTLRGWKNHGGPLLDRRVLEPAQRSFENWLLQMPLPDDPIVIPVGHSPERTWALQGGSAYRIASWLVNRKARSEVGHRSRLSLGPSLRPLKVRTQASLGLADRKLNPLRFPIGELEARQLRSRNVVLIDDFLTSGRTLRSAASAISSAQPLSIRAWVLGFRPRVGNQERSAATCSAARTGP